MALIDVKVDLVRVAKALERIADVLEIAFLPPEPNFEPIEPATLEEVVVPDDKFQLDAERFGPRSNY